MNWDDMNETEHGRFCRKCQKEVFDLTNCSIGEVIELQRKKGTICGSIRLAQVAAVTFSLSGAACQNSKTPEMTLGTICPLKPTENINLPRHSY
jgi:hypothetical protein